MRLKTIKDIKNLKNKVVLLRAEFNVPIKNNRVEKNGDYRLRKTIPTINYLIRHKAKIVIMAHRGRPKGKVVENLRLDPIARRLNKLLDKRVKKINYILGDKVKNEISKMNPGDILMLENIRFNPGEKKNSFEFARNLADLGDLYVNDAFGSCHRKHSSIVAITRFLPSYAGFLLEKEVKELRKILIKPKRPLAAIIGGAKISTKITIIQKLLPKVDQMILGGALANTILLAKGYKVGKSLVEPEMIRKIRGLNLNSKKLHMPIDMVCCKVGKNIKSKCRLCKPDAIGPREAVVDIGAKTLRSYKEIIKQARMVVWNGPMGIYEIKKFSKGTYGLARAIAKSRAYSILGGGETNQVVQTLGLEKKISFVSTGGGAMLKFLEDGTLPGIKPLLKNKIY